MNFDIFLWVNLANISTWNVVIDPSASACAVWRVWASPKHIANIQGCLFYWSVKWTHWYISLHLFSPVLFFSFIDLYFELKFESLTFSLLSYSRALRLKCNAVLIHSTHGSIKKMHTQIYFIIPNHIISISYWFRCVYLTQRFFFLRLCGVSCRVLRINTQTNQQVSLLVFKKIHHKASQRHRNVTGQGYKKIITQHHLRNQLFVIFQSNTLEQSPVA